MMKVIEKKQLINKIKLVAIDLDDTLLHDDGTVSVYTCDIIHKLRNQGVHVIIATGRMYESAKPVGETLQMGDIPMILFSGGSIQHIVSGEFIYKDTIPLPLAQKIIGCCQEHNWYVQAYTSQGLLVHHQTWQSDFYETHIGAHANFIGDALYNLNEAPCKLLVLEEPERLLQIIEFLKNQLGDEVCLVRSKSNFLEIMSATASKGAAMTYMGKKYGITPKEMVAFGNSENDISMITTAELGIAVGNAEEKIKELADFVCASNEQDGVAHWLEDYLLKED